MASPLRDRSLTVDDLYAMPDDNYKYELQAGMLVSEPLPGARHGRVAFRIAELLGAHVRSHALGVVFTNDTGFVLSRSPDTVRGPDVAFLSLERYKKFGDALTAFPGAPDLAIEVLSPSNTPAAIHAKVADYLAAGTRLVWIVDSSVNVVVEYRSLLSPRMLEEDDALEGHDVVPGLSIRVGEIFEI